MTARTLQPSELEIQREVEALRDLRRRSITPGALTIDPDLPPNQSPPSPSQSFWSNTAAAGPSDDGDSSSSSREGSSIPRRRSSRSIRSNSGDPPTNTDDPFHLFWVPASIHPEIAPAEFRAFLKEHARAPPPSDGPGMSRSNSVSSYPSVSNLARRKSMLSRQYQPSEDDGVEDEKVVPIRRNIHLNQGPQLTISDLQKLEQLAEEASRTDDPSKFRNILRRSLSLNISPSALPYMEEISDLGDEADVPIIVPPPGQILRRAARTKIRKPSLTGDGGGHRFKPARRGQVRAATAPPEPRTSSDRSSSEHGGESLESVPPEHISPPRVDKVIQPRPDSYSEETLIIDAYARDDEEESYQQKTTSPEPLIIDLNDSLVSSIPPQLPLPDVDAALFEALGPVLFQSEPPPVSAQLPESQSQQELLEPINIPLAASPPSTVTPPAAPLEPSLVPHQPLESSSEPLQPSSLQPSAPISVATDTQPSQQRKDKDKKGGLFGKWGSDRSSKKAQKNGSSEKETGFFSSLFGGKKKQETEPVSSTAGREVAQALLGASKSKNNAPHSGPGLPPGILSNNYSRYPIHVERAIYRLSHIKLANPRRPLYEQVLISNLMFWYLGVINKAQPPAQQPGGQPIVGASGPTTQPNDAEREQREKEQRERAEKERLDREEREREAETKKKEPGKRGSLTKAPTAGSPAGRRAETPIKGPQYEMQHRVMEQEYGYAGPGGRTDSAPTGGAGPGSPPRAVQSQQPEPQRNSNSNSPPRMNSTSPAPSGRHSPPQNPQRKRYSPNSSQENLLAPASNGRLAGRSLSATAVPSPPMYQVNGRARKGVSAYAVMPPGTKRPRSSEGRTDENGFEEEDVPLAVWQQQKKR